MADTVAINVVNMTVPALNHINITVINQPMQNYTNMVKSGGMYSYVDSIVGNINTVLEEVF